jgi:hypothetical protein
VEVQPLIRAGRSMRSGDLRGYIDGVPVDELANRFQVDQSTVQKHSASWITPSVAQAGAEAVGGSGQVVSGRSVVGQAVQAFRIAIDTVALALRRAGESLRPRRVGQPSTDFESLSAFGI